MITASAASRSVVVALILGMTITTQTKADADLGLGPPPLTSSSSQFVELRPMVEAPSLKLERVDGKTVDLESLKGKVVLLSFWATWCPPCRRELPMLEQLQQVLGAQGVEVIAV